jgi:cytoskeletal protein CcmA (bactofilin family)
MQTGYVTNKIHASVVILSGEILGEVLAETSINVTPTGKVQTTSLTSKRITVNGTIEGKLSASELLEVGSNGLVNGEISVKNIKTDEGGRVIGSMAMYTEPTATISQKKPEIIEATIE